MGQKRKRGQLAAEKQASEQDRPQTKSAIAKAKRKKRTRTEETGGNTPKAFLDLIHHQERVRGVKDDLKSAEQWKEEARKQEHGKALVPRPGEMLSDFNRRVDASMPIKYKKSANTAERIPDIQDFAEKRAKKQSTRQRKQNEEHLNYLNNKHERKFGSNRDEDEEYDFAELNKQGRGRKKSPDPFAVLLKNERQYKFNDTVQAPPALTIKGKFLKKAVST